MKCGGAWGDRRAALEMQKAREAAFLHHCFDTWLRSDTPLGSLFFLIGDIGFPQDTLPRVGLRLGFLLVTSSWCSAMKELEATLQALKGTN